jgi:citrate lyase synthetase
MTDSKIKLILFIAWTGLIIGVTWYILDIRNNLNNQEKTKQIEIVSKKIDSIKTIRKQKFDSIIQESNNSVIKSNKLLKKINHEKIIIPDTTYSYMCKYIENYRPK